jgi:hypothetical protein
MPALITPTGSHSNPLLYFSSSREKDILISSLNYYNDLLREGRYTYARYLLEKDEDWKLFLNNGMWLKNFYQLEEFLDWNVFSRKMIENFIVAANQNDNYELEVILIKYLHSRYGAPEPVENRFEL